MSDFLSKLSMDIGLSLAFGVSFRLIWKIIYHRFSAKKISKDNDGIESKNTDPVSIFAYIDDVPTPECSPPNSRDPSPSRAPTPDCSDCFPFYPRSPTPTPGSARATDRSVTSTPGSARTTDRSVTSTPGSARTTDRSVTSTPGSARTTDRSVTSTPGSARATDRSVTSTPGSSDDPVHEAAPSGDAKPVAERKLFPVGCVDNPNYVVPTPEFDPSTITYDKNGIPQVSVAQLAYLVALFDVPPKDIAEQAGLMYNVLHRNYDGKPRDDYYRYRKGYKPEPEREEPEEDPNAPPRYFFGNPNRNKQSPQQ